MQLSRVNVGSLLRHYQDAGKHGSAGQERLVKKVAAGTLNSQPAVRGIYRVYVFFRAHALCLAVEMR